MGGRSVAEFINCLAVARLGGEWSRVHVVHESYEKCVYSIAKWEG